MSEWRTNKRTKNPFRKKLPPQRKELMPASLSVPVTSQREAFHEDIVTISPIKPDPNGIVTRAVYNGEIYEWIRDDSDSHDGNPTWMLKVTEALMGDKGLRTLLKRTPLFVHISDDEDEEGDTVYEVWSGSDKLGDSDTIDSSNDFHESIKLAVNWMKDNPLGDYSSASSLRWVKQ